MAATIDVAPGVSIREEEFGETFIRSAGPGGQNVNKVATAVQLRFDARGAAGLPPDVKERLIRLAGHRATKDGVLVIEARRFRTQEKNRVDARARLLALIRQAAEPPPKPRRKTRPSKGAVERRLQSKAGRAAVKRLRGRVDKD
jgi:ribosome-associated protein